MASYDILTYLLDKSNIEDVLQKQVLYYDLKNITGLVDEVYAPECTIDYTTMFGGEPWKTTNKEWGEEVLVLMNMLDSAQHCLYGTLVHLPQPGPHSGAAQPNTCTAIANGGAHMVRQAAEGGPSTWNGCRQEYELVRIPELEKRGLNPWRVNRQKISPIWMEGNPRVTEVMNGSQVVPK